MFVNIEQVWVEPLPNHNQCYYTSLIQPSPITTALMTKTLLQAVTTHPCC
jgi:hypothetical protein